MLMMADIGDGIPQGFSLREGVGMDDASALKALLGATDYGVMLTGLDHTTLAVNARFGEIFGIDPDALVRTGVEEVRAQVLDRLVDEPQWRDNLDRVYRDSRLVQIDELELKNPKAWVRRYTGPVVMEDGEVLGRLWTFFDISEEVRLRRMREALASVSELVHPQPVEVFKAVVDSVSGLYGSLCLLSIQEGDWLEFRAVGGTLPGDGSMKGNTIDQSLCQFCLEARGPLIIQDAREDEKYAGRLPLQVGLTRYAGVPLWSPLGESVGTLCILDGASEELLDEEDLRFLGLMAMRVSAEYERERQIVGLEKELDSALGELRVMERDLGQKDKLAAIGTLSATVAHDIRNILASLTLDFSLHELNDPELLKGVKENLGRFSVLSERLLSYAKEHDPGGDCEVEGVFAEVLGLVSTFARISRVELEIDAGEKGLRVAVSDTQLMRLLCNLVLNGIQVIDDSGWVKVSAEGDDAWVKIWVQDSGPGVDEEHREQLFEPFVTGSVEGHGLGLYSSQRIAAAVGGKIEYLDKEGVGATFIVTLPKA